MSLDLSKLTNICRHSDKIVAACPVCRENGGDRSGNHLVIYPSGKFGCVKDRSEEHSRRIFALAGLGQNGEFFPIPQIIETPVTLDKVWPVSLLDKLIKDYSYWVGRGVKEEILEPLKGGVATDGQMKARFVFPIFNDKEEIVGFTGRHLGGNALRWKHIGKVSAWVWGGLETIQEMGQVVLVEGAGCRLALDTHGIPQSLVLWGINLSEAILAKLIELNPNDIVIATNNETSGVGNAAALKIKKTLDRFFDEGVVRIGLPLKKDFLEMSPDLWKEWKESVLGGQVPDNRSPFEKGLDSIDISEIIHD